MTKISRTIFFRLYKEVLSKCQTLNANLLEQGESEAIYGFGAHQSDTNTVKAYLENDPKVKAYLLATSKNKDSELRINGKQLYLAYRKFSKDPRLDSVRFRGIYRSIYFIFLGYKNLDDYIGKEYQEPTESDDLYLEANWTTYICYFYSFNLHKISHFTIQISYGDTIICQAYGLHDENRERIYKGRGEIIRSNIWLKLTGENGNWFTAVGSIGNLDVANVNAIFITCQGINDKNQPLAVEAVMVKTDGYGKPYLKREEIDKIYYYLMMQRRNFRLKMQASNSLATLKAKNHFHSEIAHIVGVYKVWILSSREEVIIQQKVIFHYDFRATIQSPLYGDNDELVCIYSFSKVNRLKLCLSIHEKTGTEVIGYAITDIPSKVDDRKILTGAYCYIGDSPTANPYSNYMVLVKEKEPFSGAKIYLWEIDDLLKQSKINQKLFQKLLKINDDNNKKIPKPFLKYAY